ncbi:hypothetical protein PTUN_a4196 [Pseudoalteromonas tunicata]|nr:hypothetical protein PTUN_a4196 [Pseudoalteromonas tunicata]
MGIDKKLADIVITNKLKNHVSRFSQSRCNLISKTCNACD